MSSLLSHLNERVGEVFAAHGYNSQFADVTFSDRPDLSQFQSTGPLKLAKTVGESPRTIAEKVATTLRTQAEIFTTVEVAGPGFLNFSLTDTYLSAYTQQSLENGPFTPGNIDHQRIIIDFGGPNIAKPLHVGHLRSSIIGDSLQRLFRLFGHTVFSDIHLGDWGTPMGMLIALIQRQQPELPYFNPDHSGPYPAESPVSSSELERLYPEAATLFQEEPEFQKAALQATAELQRGNPGYRALWQHFVDVSEIFLKNTLTVLDIHFDWWYGESHYHSLIEPLIAKLKAEGIAIKSDGALIIPLENETSAPLPPFILTKSDGAFLYSTTDLAAIEERVERDQATFILYVVDQRQHLHFTQVFAAARKAQLAPPSVKLEHAGFGTMNGADGKPFKTRTGGVMKLEDLIKMVTEKAAERMSENNIAAEYPDAEKQAIAQKVGIAALKFADLINNRLSNYVFDLDRFINFEGKTGPYLVYSAVRIRSIFRKVEDSSEKSTPLLPATGIERSLLLTLNHLPEVLNQAATHYTPHVIAEHAFLLAQEFNRFYQQTNILHEADQAKRSSWLTLCRFTFEQLELALFLLGIEIPERM